MRAQLIQSNSNILIPESTIRKFQEEFISPTLVYYQEEQQRGRLSWYILIFQQILFWLKNVVNGTMKDHLNQWKELHIIFSGNHGQGSMKFGIVCLLFSDTKVLMEQVTFQSAYIECKKDTHQVLMRSIAPELNESLKTSVESGMIVVRTKTAIENTVAAIENTVAASENSIAESQNVVAESENTIAW
jgi:hypothetical protein